MKVTKDNVREYLMSIADSSDNFCIEVSLPAKDMAEINLAINGWIGVRLGVVVDMTVYYYGKKIVFVPFTDDEELTYVLLENEMLRKENESKENTITKLYSDIKHLNIVIEKRWKSNWDEVNYWMGRYYDRNNLLVEKLEKIPTFIRKIFGAL